MTATAAGVMLCGPCFGRHVRLVSDVVVSIDSLLQEYQSWTKRLSCIKWFARVAAPIFKFKDFGSSAEPAWPMVHFSGPLVRTTQQPPKQNHSSGIMTTNTDGRERFVGSFLHEKWITHVVHQPWGVVVASFSFLFETSTMSRTNLRRAKCTPRAKLAHGKKSVDDEKKQKTR
jgi:hypothetical protein